MTEENRTYITHLKVTDVPWHRLTTAYGRGTDFPAHLAVLEQMEDIETVKKSLYELTTNMEHQSMKAFDPNYKLLDEMYQDNYYPAFLVDKVKDELQKVIDLLENGETDTEVVQETLDEAVCGINDLQEEFDEHDSEIETVARECIAATVAYILEWFNIPIDTEEAIRERDW